MIVKMRIMEFMLRPACVNSVLLTRQLWEFSWTYSAPVHINLNLAKDNTRKNPQVQEVELRWIRNIRPKKKSGGTLGLKTPGAYPLLRIILKLETFGLNNHPVAVRMHFAGQRVWTAIRISGVFFGDNFGHRSSVKPQLVLDTVKRILKNSEAEGYAWNGKHHDHYHNNNTFFHFLFLNPVYTIEIHVESFSTLV
jgi:hypothetical protein